MPWRDLLSPAQRAQIMALASVHQLRGPNFGRCGNDGQDTMAIQRIAIFSTPPCPSQRRLCHFANYMA
jgi:hypothetical protein